MFNESRGGRAARVVRPRHLPPAPEDRLVVIVAKYNRLLLIEAELGTFAKRKSRCNWMNWTRPAW